MNLAAGSVTGNHEARRLLPGVTTLPRQYLARLACDMVVLVEVEG